jgi:hypothetical protein
MQTMKVSTENALSGWREIASLKDVATARLSPVVFGRGVPCRRTAEKRDRPGTALSRDSELNAQHCVSDEVWPFRDRKSKIIGNPPFNRLNARIVADGLQFVLSATKLPPTI